MMKGEYEVLWNSLSISSVAGRDEYEIYQSTRLPVELALGHINIL